jgi:hypothetical protein
MTSKVEASSKLLEFNEEHHIMDDDLDLPATEGLGLLFKYDESQKKFIMSERSSMTESVLGGFPESELEEDLKNIINNPKNLNSPSWVIVFLVSFLIFSVFLVILMFFVVFWAISVLDLVFLALSVYLIRDLAKFCWIMRVKIINKANFSNLKREITRLNQKYSLYQLEWTLNENGEWIQLCKLNTYINLLIK